MADAPLRTLADYERAAQGVMGSAVAPIVYSDYAATTLRNNMAAFDRIRLRPRVLTGAGTRNLATSVLGREISLPVILAPAGGHTGAHPEGERATIRAAKAEGSLIAASVVSGYSLEEIAEAADAPRWFQLNFLKRRELNEHLVRRAEAAGFSAVVLTVDNPGVTALERFDRYGRDTSVAGAAADRVPGNFRDLPAEERPTAARISHYFEKALSWEHAVWLRSITSLPLIIKGIQTAEDAVLAVEAGVDAVVVSNHGGYALYDARATAEILPEVVAAVAGRVEVYLDGGVRRGVDVLKALALGARAVLVGRPVFWGLAVDGEEGVRRILQILREELDIAMAYCGMADVRAIPPGLVTTGP